MRGQISIHELLLKLEMNTNLNILEGATNFQEASKKFNEFKELVRKQRKVLAKKYHPDVCLDDGDRLKELNCLIDQVLKMDLQPPRPRPTVVYYSMNNGYATTSTATSGTSGFRSYWREY